MSPEMFNMGKSNTLFLSKIDREDYKDTDFFYKQCLKDFMIVRDSVGRGDYDQAVEDLIALMSRENSLTVITAVQEKKRVSVIIKSFDGLPKVDKIDIEEKS